jgi:hypothetical protein
LDEWLRKMLDIGAGALARASKSRRPGAA